MDEALLDLGCTASKGWSRRIDASEQGRGCPELERADRPDATVPLAEPFVERMLTMLAVCLPAKRTTLVLDDPQAALRGHLRGQKVPSLATAGKLTACAYC